MHHFFEGLNWDDVFNCRLQPPIDPADLDPFLAIHPHFLSVVYGEKKPKRRGHLEIYTDRDGNTALELEGGRQDLLADHRLVISELFTKNEYLCPEFASYLGEQPINMEMN
ncbi:unnamed protein product [Hymenolepis diminuta]|uniref:Uncharacterized protein n=1 Tax=Hymenolepis diminuta TaxID=6216 RepID=A0A564Y3N8_HYMDI|nr:unnamed protein product [Hymenolepis diminuta]